jgi:hypothetical protein
VKSGGFSPLKKKVKFLKREHRHFGVEKRLYYGRRVIWRCYWLIGLDLRALAARIWLIFWPWDVRFE